MDLYWERSHPYYQLTNSELIHYFPFFKKERVINISLIEIGCRNSNYKVITLENTYLVRVTSQDIALISNEIALNKELRQLIKIPRLLDYSSMEKRFILLYEFIAGDNLSYYLKKSKIDNKSISEIGESLAKIHSFVSREDIKTYDLPAFNTWYDLFLSNDKTYQILGKKRVELIKSFIRNNQDILQEIDSLKSFIHSDFRPANMILSLENDIFFLDWEYSTIGHSLADIGQLFRYKTCFTQKNRDDFYSAYINHCKTRIPKQWYEMSRLRDLINPLQLLGTVEKKLQLERDMLLVIDDIIDDVF